MKMNKFKCHSGFLPRFIASLLVALAAGCGGGQDPILGTGGAAVVGGVCVPAVGIAKAITAYSFAGAAGIIDEAAKTIAVTVPSGTNVTALVATFATTGTGVKVGVVAQTSGTTANNFTSPVAYTVTAGDCTTVIYTVTVTVSVLPVAACAGTGPLPLASANNFAVLAGTALTLTNPQVITGDVGSPSITPAAGPSTLVGTQFDTSTGSLPLIAAAVTDMQTAVACAVGRGCDVTYPAGAIDFAIQPQPLAAGHHCVTGAMSVGSNLTLTNPGVYIFDASNGGAGGALTSANTITVKFGGAANAANSSVFWVSSGAASSVTIGDANTFLGTILCSPCAAGATIKANTTLLPGRVLSSAAVNLNGGTNTITRPVP